MKYQILMDHLSSAMSQVQNARWEVKQLSEKETVGEDMFRVIGHLLDQQSSTLFLLKEMLRNK